jgi:uncharacterized protein with FMN-binding domain
LRRTVLSIFAVVFGTALLVGLKSTAVGAPPGTVAGAPLNPGSSGPGASGPPGSGQPGPNGSPGAPGSTARPTTTPGPPGSTPKPGQTTTAPAGGGTTTTTPPVGGGPTTTTAPPTTTTYTGSAIAVRTAESPTTKSSSCGDCADYSISVTITVSGGRITTTSVSYNPSPGGSSSYASRANSQLSQSILSSQTWNLGRVSGATYAGNAWEQSARSAMQQAGLPV